MVTQDAHLIRSFQEAVCLLTTIPVQLSDIVVFVMLPAAAVGLQNCLSIKVTMEEGYALK
jgi:hypothetical protein